MKNNKVLVTGGAGFIGSNLCQRLIELGYNVVCLDNLDDFYNPSIKLKTIHQLQSHPNFSFIEGDIRDKQLLGNIFIDETIKMVIHLAAKVNVRYSMNRRKEYFDTNVTGTKCLVESMKKHGKEKIIFASSSSVYGNLKGKQSESIDLTNVQISPYAETKIECERMLYQAAGNHKLQAICLRFFSVYGENQRPDLAFTKFLKQQRNSEPITVFGNGESMRDYTYVGDIVAGIISGINLLKDKNDRDKFYEIINIGSGNPITINSVLETMTEIIGKQLSIINMPKQNGDVDSTFADINKARKLLRYEPKVNFKVGFAKFHDWFSQNEIMYIN